MKKYFWAFALVLMLLPGTMVLTSCGDDDDNVDSSELMERLQGTWDLYSGSMKVMGQTITIDRNTFLSMKPDGVEYWDLTLSFNGNRVNGETYTLKGDQLIIGDMELYENFVIRIKTVNDEKLILDETISAEGNSITVSLEYHKR